MGKKLLLLGATTILVVLVAEFALAVFFPQRTLNNLRERAPAVTAPSDLLPYELRPNASRRLFGQEFDTTVRINSLGYRSEEFDPRKGDQARILALGDSFTFGYGVENEETYPARLQERLRARCPGRALEVINAGFASGQYPDTYYLYLRERGLALDPDLVIVGFFVGNDIDHDMIKENVWTQVNEDGLPDKIEQPQVNIEGGHRVSKLVPRRYRYPILRNSHLVQGLVALKSFASQPAPRAFHNPYMYRPEYQQRTLEQVETVKRLFSAMKELTEDRGIEFLVVIIPTREQVYPDEFPFADPPYSGKVDLEKPQRIFGEFFEEAGIDYVDPLPELRVAAAQQRLYFPEDQHLTPEGQELLSGILADSRSVISRSCDRGDGKRASRVQPSPNGVRR